MGTAFDEIVIATDYDDARRVALARNPGASIVSVTAVFDPVPEWETPVSSSSSQPSYNNSGSSFNPLGFMGAIVIGLLGMGFLGSVVEDTDTYEPNTTIQQERVQPRQSYQPPVSNVETSFFTQDGIQQQAIDDLGQDWDN